MFIRAYCVLGIKTKDGRSPVYPGSVAEVSDDDGLRMIERGCAVEVNAGASVRTGKAAPAPQPGENPLETGNAQNEPSEGENEGLEEMSFNELKAMAKELGIETGKIKSKAGMIDAITAAQSADFPDLAPQDVIEE
jgi:hypothetical protein